MSWLFSRALVGEYSEGTCSDGELSVLSSESHTPQAYLPPDRMMAFSRLSRFGMTFGHLTASHGEALLTSYLAGFLVRPIAQRLRAKILQTTSGRKCDGSWQMSLPGTYLPRTYQTKRLTQRATTSRRWVSQPLPLPLERMTWVVTTFGRDIGFLHTPTTKANYSAASMQKWPSARSFVTVFGRPDPINQEWLMGWPLGWTDIQPLGTDRFQSWLSAHSLPYALHEAA
ncbi:hypothetical protein 23F_00035 [Ralstonia phage Gerry]|uniref:Uncharacterized protein n=1 Tax=Ralstonia phage Gerry TaxID=2759727 RepID=A0A7G5BA74_9CAUD|nr:hypothetical protein KMC47_gp35 [Ralstonia phage Gerry]QMV33197.1 hypothetical protein 23F_00035 [Ralstonia phage Gerry]